MNTNANLGVATVTGVEQIGGRWVGTCRDFRNRVAVVTEEAATREQALEAVARWAARPSEPGVIYDWQPSKRYPGFFDVVMSGLGLHPAEQVPREPIAP